MSAEDTVPDVADQIDAAEPPPPEPEAATMGRPVLPAQPADAKDERETIQTVRTFCMTGQDPGGQLEIPGKGVLPVPMHAMRDPELVRTGEPVLMLQEEGTVLPFGEWLVKRIPPPRVSRSGCLLRSDHNWGAGTFAPLRRLWRPPDPPRWRLGGGAT